MYKTITFSHLELNKTVKCKYTIANCDQGKPKFGQGKIRENQGISFLKLCGHPVIRF